MIAGQAGQKCPTPEHQTVFENLFFLLFFSCKCLIIPNSFHAETLTVNHVMSFRPTAIPLIISKKNTLKIQFSHINIKCFR